MDFSHKISNNSSDEEEIDEEIEEERGDWVLREALKSFLIFVVLALCTSYTSSDRSSNWEKIQTFFSESSIQIGATIGFCSIVALLVMGYLYLNKRRSDAEKEASFCPERLPAATMVEGQFGSSTIASNSNQPTKTASPMQEGQFGQLGSSRNASKPTQSSNAAPMEEGQFGQLGYSKNASESTQSTKDDNLMNHVNMRRRAKEEKEASYSESEPLPVAAPMEEEQFGHLCSSKDEQLPAAPMKEDQFGDNLNAPRIQMLSEFVVMSTSVSVKSTSTNYTNYSDSVPISSHSKKLAMKNKENVEVVVTTPVRRSSRIKSLSVTSP